MRRRIPFALTTLRLSLGPFNLICALAGAPRLVYLPILIVGTISDIVDGILARRLQVATPFLRRYDSVTDVIYYLFVLAAVWILCRPVVTKTWWAILILLIAEAASVVVCVARFGKYPATHSYLSKFYGLCLLGGLIALLVFNATGCVIVTLMAVGIITNAEIIAMHFVSDAPPVDVPSIFALRGRRDG
jgi:CDP-diacylglycerol--glycerol-3-phosphate 3-phosphatidyltransferase